LRRCSPGPPFVHIADLRLIVDYELTETALQHLFLDSGQRADHVVGVSDPEAG
jgi:hypothetical protein